MKARRQTRKIKGKNDRKLPEHIPHDNPLFRHEATTRDLFSGSNTNLLSNFRLAALKHADEMLTSDINNWVQLGPTAIPFGQGENTRGPVTGRVTAIVIDPTNPNIIYVGTAQGGIWKTTDGGRNWIATSDQAKSLAIGALVIDPINPNILYAGTGEGNLLGETSYYGCGILKTIDGGKEWKLRGDSGVFNGSRFYRLAVNHKKTIQYCCYHFWSL